MSVVKGAWGSGSGAFTRFIPGTAVTSLRASRFHSDNRTKCCMQLKQKHTNVQLLNVRLMTRPMRYFYCIFFFRINLYMTSFKSPWAWFYVLLFWFKHGFVCGLISLEPTSSSEFQRLWQPRPGRLWWRISAQETTQKQNNVHFATGKTPKTHKWRIHAWGHQTISNKVWKGEKACADVCVLSI